MRVSCKGTEQCSCSIVEFCSMCFWKVTQFNFYQIYLLHGFIILFSAIRYVCNYYHKARLCWALSSLHFCNWLVVSPIRSHEVLMAKDQCTKWFHYIQKALCLAKRKKPWLRWRGTHTHTEANTYTLIPTHSYSGEVMYDHISEQQKIDYPYHTV